MGTLFLALKVLSVLLLIMISFRSVRMFSPFVIKNFNNGNRPLAILCAIPVIALVGLALYVVGYNLGH